MAACLRDPGCRVDENPQLEEGQLVAQSAWDLKQHSSLVVHVIHYTTTTHLLGVSDTTNEAS